MHGRLLKSGHLDGHMNMAIDEMLLLNNFNFLNKESESILRLYGWSEPTLSLGYFQKFPFSINFLNNPKTEKKHSFGIVRRLTGGGTVLHDIEITYSFIISESNSLIPAGIVESYKAICQGIVKGLEKLGVKAEFFETKDIQNSGQYATKTDFCFATHSKYDVLVGGKKLVGSAQRRRKGIILQHGSIILDIDKEKNSYLLEKGINCFQEAVSLKQILGYQVDFEKISQILVEGFKTALGIDFKRINLNPWQIKSAESLKNEKYETDQWTKLYR